MSSNPRSRYVPWRTRRLVILRDKRCQACRKPVRYCTGSSVRGNACWRAYDDEMKPFHLDHRVPYSRGGHSGPSNIQLLCEACNLGKGESYG